jgi:hypothetical protein
MKESQKHFRRKRATKSTRGISTVITTIIISGALLVILVVASFVSENILSIQLASTEFDQATTNMGLLDQVIQDTALRQGAGGYVQFNQRTGGIGWNEATDNISIAAVFPNGTRIPWPPWSPLLTLVYRGGSKVSGAATNITGAPNLNVSISDPLSFLRVETGQGIWVKLDYNRVRTISMGTLIANNSAYDFYDITFIRLIKGSISGASGTVNFKVQNLNINTTSIPCPNGVNVTAQLNAGPSIDVVSARNSAVVMVTEIQIRVSIS